MTSGEWMWRFDAEYTEKRRGGGGGGNDGQKYFQKTEVLDSCVVPASTYGLETLALSELRQHKLHVYII